MEDLMNELIQKTQQELDNNKEWEKRYKRYLREIRNNSAKCERPFRLPTNLSLYTSMSSRKNMEYQLRFRGMTVGHVKVEDKYRKIITLTCKKTSYIGCPLKLKTCTGCPLKSKEKGNWQYTEAGNYRSFFKNLPTDVKTNSPEHAVENALLKEFKSSGKAIKYIQPVKLHNGYFQMPTPLKASDHNPEYSGPKGGGIDILSRIVTSEGRNCLCVMEVKDENKESESQATAISQAIIYATFIAKLVKRNDKWWEFFSENTSRNKEGSRLDKKNIYVVTVMPAGTTETFENQTLEVPGTDITLHCHSLYYDKGQFDANQTFRFSGTFLDEIKK